MWKDKERRREYVREYLKKYFSNPINRERDRKYRREYRRKRRLSDPIYRAHIHQYQIKYRITNKKRRDEYQRKYVSSSRMILLNLLGGKCVKCSISDPRCLQFDHINGGGRRELLKRNTIQHYRYYSNHLEEAKEKLQILCANCNWIKKFENKETRGNLFRRI